MQESDLYRVHFGRDCQQIVAAREESKNLIEKARQAIASCPDGVCVVANGSVARGELTSQSDFDVYAICEEEEQQVRAESALNNVLNSANLKDCAVVGAFGGVHTKDKLIDNIGGNDETNASFTRRMLVLLESHPIVGKENIISEIVGSYISDDITHHQLGRYLLNDVIRFYRTMCVDFERKTSFENKPWGIRSIKLVFSRKLIYFSGILMCAELAEMRAAEKRRRLQELVMKTPIERMLHVMGSAALPALFEYDYFLKSLNDDDVRQHLQTVNAGEGNKSEIYRDLKSSAHRFNWKLTNALSATYPQSHPIHDALIL